MNSHSKPHPVVLRAGHRNRFSGNSEPGGAENGTPGTVQREFLDRWCGFRDTWRGAAGENRFGEGRGGGAAALRPYSAAASPGRSRRATREWTQPGAGGPPHTQHQSRWCRRRDTGPGLTEFPCPVVLRAGHRDRFGRDYKPCGETKKDRPQGPARNKYIKVFGQ